MANGLLTAHLEGVCSTVWACPSKWSLVVNFTRESGLKESRHTCQTYPDSWDACWVFSKTQISFTLGKKKKNFKCFYLHTCVLLPKKFWQEMSDLPGRWNSQTGQIIEGDAKIPVYILWIEIAGPLRWKLFFILWGQKTPFSPQNLNFPET